MCQKPKLISMYSTSQRSPATVSPSPEKAINNSLATPKPVLIETRRTLKPRRVQFSHAEVVGTVTERSAIPIEDYTNIWYFAHELESFKNDVRMACQTMRDDGIVSGNSAASTIYNSNNFTIRGLEQRMCKNRQRNKALSVWGTLKAQQRNRDPEFIAMIAKKCSFTAAQLAYMEAARDYCEIYNPGEIASLSKQIETFASQAFPIKLKRKSPSPDSSPTNGDCVANTNSRNVRIRIN